MGKADVAAYEKVMEGVIKQFIFNFEVLTKLMSNFMTVHINLLSRLEEKIICKLRCEDCFSLFKIWTDYFFGVRSEYAFVHFGAIINSNHKRFSNFVHKRTTSSQKFYPLVSPKILEAYDVVSCSNVGITWSQGKNKGPSSDSIDEKYPALEGYSLKLEEMLKDIIRMYSEMLSIFNENNEHGHMSPILESKGASPFNEDCFDEKITLRIRSVEVTYSGSEIRKNCFDSPDMLFVTNIPTIKKCSQNCTKSKCSVCGNFNSYKQMVEMVTEGRRTAVAVIALKQKQSRQRIQETGDDDEESLPENIASTASVIVPLEVSNKAGWFFSGYQTNQMTAYENTKLDKPYLTQCKAIYVSLFRSGYKVLAELSSFDRFMSAVNGKMSSEFATLNHHFDSLVRDKEDSNFANDDERYKNCKVNFGEYLKLLKSSKGKFGDEFLLKAMATFFEFEAYVLDLSSSGGNESVLHFNPFIEYPNITNSVVTLVYFGKQDYQVGVRLSRGKFPVHIHANARLWLDNILLVNTYFTNHDVVEDDDGETDMDCSFVSNYCADLTTDDDEVKHDLEMELEVTQADINSKRNSDIVRLGSLVYANKPNSSSIRIMDTLFRDVKHQSASGDHMLDLFNAIQIAARGKMYISCLLETAVTALYFSDSRTQLRDEVDWLQYMNYIKLAMIARYRLEQGLESSNGVKLTKHSLSRAINSEIAKINAPLLERNQYANEEAYSAAVLIDERREEMLVNMQLKRKELDVRIDKQNNDYVNFKDRLGVIMWEIVEELWKIWFSLSKLDKVGEEKFMESSSEFVDLTSSVEESAEYIVNLRRYTNSSNMDDFQALRTTYKSYWSSRRDLPVSAEDAKEKHNKMKIKVEGIKAKAAEKLAAETSANKKSSSSSYYPSLCDGEGRKSKKRKKGAELSLFRNDSSASEGEEEEEEEEEEVDIPKKKSKKKTSGDSVSLTGTIEIISGSNEGVGKSLRSKSAATVNKPQTSVKIDNLASSEDELEFTPVKRATGTGLYTPAGFEEDTQPQYSTKRNDKSPNVNTTAESISPIQPTVLRPIPVVHDLSIEDSSTDVSSTDHLNAVKRAHIHFQHRYPKSTSNSEILSFSFGLVPIIHASLGVASFDFDLLKLVCNGGLLESCVSSCKGILLPFEGGRVPNDYILDMDLAYRALRDKHVLSVIVKILLLPLVLCWFRPILKSTSIMYSLPKRSGDKQEILVNVKEFNTGSENHFFDIEKTSATDNNSIDYFA